MTGHELDRLAEVIGDRLGLAQQAAIERIQISYRDGQICLPGDLAESLLALTIPSPEVLRETQRYIHEEG